jgi:predicted MFS family arabinose efflux permease
VLVVAGVAYMARKIADPGVQGARPEFDLIGAILSAVGLVFVVLGILSTGKYGWGTAKDDVKIGDTVIINEGGIAPIWPLVAIGLILLAWFYIHLRSRERAGKVPLVSTRIFHNTVSNLGLVTQNVQWLTLQGSFFVVSVFLQTVRGYSAVETGLILTASTVGILLSSGAAGRFAKRRSQVVLIRAGFVTMIAGTILLLLLAHQTDKTWTFLPGLFLIGFGVGVMLTSSVNVVQSSFPEKDQGEISGVSRSVSNLGSSMGTALVGSVLVARAAPDEHGYAVAIGVMIFFGLVGLGASLLIPRDAMKAGGATAS